MNKLKIALGATLHKKVQKDSTGGTEVFLYFLARELVKKGHEVTVFASGDSLVEGKLDGISTEEEINKIEQNQRIFYGYQLLESERIAENQNKFDIIHINYFEPFLFTPFSKLIKKPVIYTVHSDIFASEDWQKLTLQMVKPNDTFVFVSKNAANQARLIQNKTHIYNGLDISLFPFSETHDNYLLWLGRVRKKKGIKEAVLAAIQANKRLIISGVIDNPEEKLFFEKEIIPIIQNNKNIKLLGPSSFEQKVKLYQGAQAFLFPISWEEPFGLTMIEAMACGTPVIGFDRGAVSEVIQDQKTGFVVKDIKSMVERIKQIDSLKRKDCRARVEQRFALNRVVKDYESLYFSKYEQT